MMKRGYRNSLLLVSFLPKKPSLLRGSFSVFPFGNRALKLRSKLRETRSSFESRLKRVLSKFRRNVIPVEFPTQNLNPTRSHTKVVTDIDDTIVSSGGVKIFGITIGGVDNQYLRGQLYPGAIQFAFELSHSQQQTQPVPTIIVDDNAMQDNENPIVDVASSQSTPSTYVPIGSKVSVLTARAKELKYLLRLRENGKICSAYRQTGQAHGNDDWGIGEVYYGSILEWIFHERKGLRKFKNFEILFERDLQLNKQHNLNSKYILIGDTGEKDEDAGERIATKFGENIKAIFLHTVYDCNRPLVSSSTKTATNQNTDTETAMDKLPPDRVVNGVPIFYFRTYIGAASKAHKLGLITDEALKRVAMTALSELETHDKTTSSKPISSLTGVTAQTMRLRARKSLSRLYRISSSNSVSKQYIKKFFQRENAKNVSMIHTKWSRWSELMADIKENESLKHLIKDLKKEVLPDDNETKDDIGLN